MFQELEILFKPRYEKIFKILFQSHTSTCYEGQTGRLPEVLQTYSIINDYLMKCYKIERT